MIKNVFDTPTETNTGVCMENERKCVNGEQPVIPNVQSEQTVLCLPEARPVETILIELLENVKADSPSEAGGLSEGIVLSDKVLVVITSEHVRKTAEEKNWGIARHQENYYLYNGQYWERLEVGILKNFLGLAAEQIGVQIFTARHYNFKDALLKQFYETAFFNPPKPPANETRINLCNGTFVVTLEKQYLKPFDRIDFMKYKLHFPYDVTAAAPAFQKYLDRVLPVKEKQQVLAEFIGYAFTKNSVLKLEKAAILYGTGANGKSVFFDVISALLGSENISNVTLQNLTDPNNYAKTFLDGKILNYASEISSKMNTVEFKTLVSGEPIQARVIYQPPFMMQDYARFMFNTNILPTDVEHNEGFYRRFLIIGFTETIPESERDPQLAKHIIENELSGVFNWVVEGLYRLLANRSFTACAEIDNALANYKRESDTVCMFLDEMLYIPGNGGTVSLKALYSEYTKYCKENGYRARANKDFSARLRTQRFKIERKASGRFVYVTKDVPKKLGISDISDTVVL